jgi:hypothetical protein
VFPFLLRTCETKCVNKRQEASTSHYNRKSRSGVSNGFIFTARGVSITTCYVKTVITHKKLSSSFKFKLIKPVSRPTLNITA